MKHLAANIYLILMGLMIALPAEAQRVEPLLIDQDRPALLDYDIDEEKRSNLSTCAISEEDDWSFYPFQFDSAVKNCWPNLVIAKRYVQLFYAYGEASWHQKDAAIARQFRNQAFALTQAIRKEHEEPIWPFEKLMLANSFDIEAKLLSDVGQIAKAVDAKAEEVRILEDLNQTTHLAYRLPIVRYDKTKLQLKLARSEAARQELDEIYPDGFPRRRMLWYYVVTAHVSAVARDAAASGDKKYALDLLDRFISSMDRRPPGFRRDISKLTQLRSELSQS